MRILPIYSLCLIVFMLASCNNREEFVIEPEYTIGADDVVLACSLLPEAVKQQAVISGESYIDPDTNCLQPCNCTCAGNPMPRSITRFKCDNPTLCTLHRDVCAVGDTDVPTSNRATDICPEPGFKFNPNNDPNNFPCPEPPFRRP